VRYQRNIMVDSLKNEVTLVASYTLDRIIYADGESLTQQGGPASYIGAVLKQEGVGFEVVPGEEFEVDLKVFEQEVVVQIHVCDQPQPIPLPLKSEYLIVSPIAGEWPLIDPHYCGRVCMDIQGYVPLCSENDEKREISIPPDFCPYALKATAEELTYLPADFVEAQKKRILVITKGKKGADLYYRDDFHHFDPPFVVEVIDAIGAGDSFLGFYVAELSRNVDPVAAARSATDKVAFWLRESKRNLCCTTLGARG
jgi:hypothetical protein